MKRTLIQIDKTRYPAELQPRLKDAVIYDSSCSPQAKVIFIDKDSGYYLKTSAKGSLKAEAEMTQYFFKKGMAAEVLDYISTEQDYLLTRRITGEDGTFHAYLAEPKKLCDIWGEALRTLHDTAYKDCPVANRTEGYLQTAKKNKLAGIFDRSIFEGRFGDPTPEDAWAYIEQHRHLLKTDTLIHGDYCLPNIMLDHWKFSGFIDLGNAGIGDRHIDLFWGIWTLWFNLKTDRYNDRFLDAYGRTKVDNDLLKLVATIEMFG
jgi:kanamycin kinase